MLIDATVLAGGRSSRLGSVAKATLVFAGHTLLDHTVSAALTVSRRCVIVGPTRPSPSSPLVFGDPSDGSRILMTRESEPFAGPAAALAAGVQRLSVEGSDPSDAILVLACDMPGIVSHLPLLVATLDSAPAVVDGAITIDEFDIPQPLASIFRREALERALTRFEPRQLTGLSVRKLLEILTVIPVAASPGTTDDVDTWDDAARLGVTAPSATTREEAP